jgi:formiminotetrahydrofolate cyclodeaminase
MPEPYLDLRVGELLDAVARRGGPGAGAVAALHAAAAASLVELAARASDQGEWPDAGGAAAQARKLRDRLVPLARKDAEAYQEAVAQLKERGDDFALGEALARAADIPLEIAEHAENVAGLAAEAAARAAGEVRADASAAAALALGAAWAAAKLVEVNLSMREDDPRLVRARAITAGAIETARGALAETD